MRGLILFLALALAACPAAAQSLSPMRDAGTTPSAVKGFRLMVGNPYKTRMSFIVTPMEPGFAVPARDAAVSVSEFRLAPGATRPVIVSFRIDPALKERTIAVCVMPKQVEGPILPRVCGTYTGRLAGAGG